jgi:hypothetical protein
MWKIGGCGRGGMWRFENGENEIGKKGVELRLVECYGESGKWLGVWKRVEVIIFRVNCM